MKKLIFVILFCLPNAFAFAQDKPSTLDFKLGVGRAVLGTGDYRLYRFEGELTKKWNKLISSSIAINVGIGYDNQIFLRQVNSFHTDLNVFVSPFGNQRANNFKIGTGFAWINANVTASQGRRLVYDEPTKTYTQVEMFATETRRVSGFSIIIEDEINIGTKYLLGLKLIVQPYTNADILSGASLKFGIKL